MTANFKNIELVNFSGSVLVNNNNLPKIYSSMKLAQTTANKVGGRVVMNVSRFIIVK